MAMLNNQRVTFVEKKTTKYLEVSRKMVTSWMIPSGGVGGSTRKIMNGPYYSSIWQKGLVMIGWWTFDVFY